MKDQIEEMGKLCPFYEECKCNLLEATRCNFDCDMCDFAKTLYNAGYRKQSEGVWIYNPDGIDWGLGAWQCSQCGCNNHNLPTDKNTNPLVWAGAKYCPNCGAQMKGGAE